MASPLKSEPAGPEIGKFRSISRPARSVEDGLSPGAAWIRRRPLRQRGPSASDGVIQPGRGSRRGRRGRREGGLGGRELAVESLGDDASQPGRDIDIAFVAQSLGDDASQPGRDIDIAFVAQAIETGAQLGFDAALDIFVTLHYMT